MLKMTSNIISLRMRSDFLILVHQLLVKTFFGIEQEFKINDCIIYIFLFLFIQMSRII